jgi:hypothetical protein
VITGFRVARGGAQERYGVRPDLTILGKIVGGGLPAAAFAGPRALMERVAPAGDVYQAGTLSGNPLAVAAGLPSVGVLQNSLNGVTFNGTTGQMSTTSATGAQKVITDPFQFHAFAIIKPTAAGGADATTPFNNPGIVADSGGRWGIFYYTTGGNDFIQAQVFDTGGSHFAQVQANVIEESSDTV